MKLTVEKIFRWVLDLTLLVLACLVIGEYLQACSHCCPPATDTSKTKLVGWTVRPNHWATLNAWTDDTSTLQIASVRGALVRSVKIKDANVCPADAGTEPVSTLVYVNTTVFPAMADCEGGILQAIVDTEYAEDFDNAFSKRAINGESTIQISDKSKLVSFPSIGYQDVKLLVN